MKREKMLFVAMLVFGVVLCFAANGAFAVPGSYLCKVESVGVLEADQVEVILTHAEDGVPSEFSNLRFRATVPRAKEMLALALTAMNIGVKVRCWCNPDLPATEQRILWSMFLTSEPAP